MNLKLNKFLGLFDGTNDAGKEIVKCIDMAKNGIHAIILVFTTRSRFSEEEQATFLTLQALFGPKIVEYMLVIFTGGDDLEADGKTLDDYLSLDCPQALQVSYNIIDLINIYRFHSYYSPLQTLVVKK